jgi:DNA-binding transcriptional LysR family regulator
MTPLEIEYVAASYTALLIMFSHPDLAVLLAVADTGSLRKAAERVHKTQSAVSQAIQRMETAVGFALLDRSAYRATLTSKGELFAKRARPMLHQSERLRAFARLVAQGVEDRVCIAVHGAIAPAFWSGLFGNIARVYADTVFEVRAGEGDHPLRALAEGRTDLALLLSAPPDRLALGLDHVQVGAMDFATCVRSDLVHGANAEEVLQSLPQVLVSDFEDASGTGFGVVEGHRHWRVSHHAAKAAVILQGLGWGSVPRDLVAAALDSGLLTTVAFGAISRGSRRPISLYRQRDRTMGPVVSAIWAAAITPACAAGADNGSGGSRK